MGSVTTQSRRAVVLAALPGNLNTITASTGLGRTTVWRWLKDIHQAGESHITSWSRTEGGGPFLPTYTAGPGADAKCKLKPLTQAQKTARHMAKAKRDGRWEFRAAAQRARWAADRANYKKDPLMAALFCARACP